MLPFLLPATALVYANVANALDSSARAFDWASIVPSEQLEYSDCYDGFKCARLVVPLDWLHSENNRTIAIAIVKLPAVVPDDDPTFGGTVIFNPGGPGVSGVSTAVRGAAKAIQNKLTDKPGIRHYEILSFDPRGVGNTAPVSDCFRSNGAARNAWILEDRGKGSLTSGKAAISYGLGLMKFYSDHCKLDEELNGALEYVGTPSVARDMVEMVDKIDELRKREAAQRQGKLHNRFTESQGEIVRDGDEQGQEISKAGLYARHGPEDKNNPVPRIQYLGFSYGTVLGNTFASMFPGRVGRMVLDGVVDVKDYYNGDASSSLKDTDKMFDEFWRGCFQSTATKCPFRLSHENPKKAQEHFWKWITGRDSLNHYPVAMPSANGGLMVIRGSDVLVAVGDALHEPTKKFQPLALALYEGMIGGDLTRMATLVDETVTNIGDTCQSDSPQFKPEATWAVVCSDGKDYRNRDIEFWTKYIQKQEKLSRVFGPFFATFRFTCSSWPFRSKWEYRSPFKTPAPSSDPLYLARPAAPLLFLTNRLDPVTPLSSARAMAKGHPGSGILVQLSLGHTTMGGGPSRCTWEAVRDYFHEGAIQAKEVSCSADCDPWGDSCDQTIAKRSNKDKIDWDVWVNMTTAIKESLRPRPWLPGAADVGGYM